MGFRRSDLQEAFFVPGTYPFRVWGYGTTDALADVLARDYFRTAGGLMHTGDLIYVSVRPGVRARPAWERAAGPEPRLSDLPAAMQGEMRMALVMVRGATRGTPSVRLVQDFGRPDDPDAGTPAAATSTEMMAAAPALPVKRGRGRPPGSKNKGLGERAAME